MPQSDGSESQAFGSASVSFLSARASSVDNTQPAEVLDVFRAFRGEGGIERISLQHTQQLVVVESLAFMVAPLH
jgi:hypothetical protein